MKAVSIEVTVLARSGDRVRRRKLRVVNGRMPREQWLRDCMSLAFGDDFADGDLFLVLEGRIVARWMAGRRPYAWV